jgi:hypothetical protein
MKLTVHLIPIPPPNSTGPDPPDTVFHYTTGHKLKRIINSGQILPSTAHVPANEKPVTWFSTQDQWEPTVTECPIPRELRRVDCGHNSVFHGQDHGPTQCCPLLVPAGPSDCQHEP